MKRLIKNASFEMLFSNKSTEATEIKVRKQPMTLSEKS